MPGLTDRRIGFLFLVFVALLSLATLRAGWLGAVRSPALSMTGTARSSGMAAPGADHGDVIRSRARDPNRPGHPRAA